MWRWCARLLDPFAHTDEVLSFQAVFSSLTILEVVAIAAQTYPHTPLSDAALAALTPSGRAPDLRITPAFLCGVTLNIAGAVLRAWSFKTLGVFFTGPVFIRRDQ